MKKTTISLAILAAIALVGGCGHDALHGELAVPRQDPVAAKTDSDSRVDTIIERAKTMVQKAPKEAAGYNLLGKALMQKGRESGELDRYSQALTAFEKAVELAPNDSESLHNLAWAWTMFHRFDKSIALAKKAIAADEVDPFAWGVLVDSYMELGKYDLALDAAQKMIDLRPDMASYSRAAQVQWVMGDVKSAMLLMSKAANAGGLYAENAAWCRTQLGDMYWKTGAVAAAEQQYAAVLKVAKENRHANFGMARVRLSQGKRDEALAMMAKAVEGDIVPMPYVMEYARALEAAGMKEEAAKQWPRVERIIAEHTKHGIEGDELIQAELWLERGDKARALDLAQHEADHHTSWQAYSTLAWAYHLNNRHAEAKVAIEKAMKVGVQEAQLFDRASAIFAALGEKGKSERYAQLAVSLNPNFVRVAGR